MRFVLPMGVPEMEDFWKTLARGRQGRTLTPAEEDLATKLAKALSHLRDDPRHPGLESHEIGELTHRYGRKVFQSYLENRTPAAGRIYWVYGPARGEITVIGLDAHPEDEKRDGYDRVRLSEMPPRGRSS